MCGRAFGTSSAPCSSPSPCSAASARSPAADGVEARSREARLPRSQLPRVTILVTRTMTIRDVRSCPPGSEVWTPCRQRFIDWQTSDAVLTLSIYPGLDSVRRWASGLGGDDPGSIEVPLETISDGRLEGMTAERVFSDAFVDRASAKLRRVGYDIRISAALAYVHSRAVCERRCENGLWTARFVQQDEAREWTFERRIPMAITQDAIGTTIKAVDAAFVEVAALAARIPRCCGTQTSSPSSAMLATRAPRVVAAIRSSCGPNDDAVAACTR